MKAKYDIIGTNYNATRKADPYILQRLAHLLGKPDGSYADVGCGTGNYTGALFNMGYTITGIDPSGAMLKKARLNFPGVKWVQGSAENTSLENNSIQGSLCTLTIHHWPDIYAGFRELFRINAPGAPVVLFTSTSDQMKGYWLNHYFPDMMQESIDQMPSRESIHLAMTSAGFVLETEEKYDIRTDLEDLFLYCGKHNPEMYFNSELRKGISSFSSLANREEVAKGLKRLKYDVVTRQIDRIRDSYANNTGDYLFLKGIKP